MIHPYAYADSTAPDLDVIGVGDEQVVGLVIGSFKLYVTLHADRPHSDVRNLLRHNDVAEALTSAVHAAPLRFDVWFESADACAHDFLERQDELRRVLRLVARRSEVGVRILHDDSGKEGLVGRHLRGRSYLAALAEQRSSDTSRSAPEELAQLNTALETCAVTARAVPTLDQQTAASRAYLVDTERAAWFAHRARRLVDELGIDGVVTGPWPPYSFITFTPSLAVRDGAPA